MFRQWTIVGSHVVLSSAPSTQTERSGPSGARRSSLDNSNPCVSYMFYALARTYLLLSHSCFSPHTFPKPGNMSHLGSIIHCLWCVVKTKRMLKHLVCTKFLGFGPRVDLCHNLSKETTGAYSTSGIIIKNNLQNQLRLKCLVNVNCKIKMPGKENLSKGEFKH